MYICKSRLRYKGRLYEEGDEVVFADDEDPRVLQELVDDGVVGSPEPAAPAGDPEAAGGEAANTDHARRVELLQAYAALDPEDKALWTAGGQAKTAALENIAGGGVSGAERDEVAELFEAAQRPEEGAN